MFEFADATGFDVAPVGELPVDVVGGFRPDVVVVVGRFRVVGVGFVDADGLVVGRDVLPPIIPPPVTPPSCCPRATPAQVNSKRTVAKQTNRGAQVGITFSPA